MPIASELTHLAPWLFLWQVYDPAVKAELFSTALATVDGTYLVDPIPLDREPLADLAEIAPIRAIIITNANHWRAAPEFATQFSVPILVRKDSFPANSDIDVREIRDDGKITPELRAIDIDGAAPGEVALFFQPNGGTLIVGDSLINFDPLGFAFLPAKYCTNHGEMRRSLRKLLDCQAQRVLFAHGTPILSGANERLQKLLDDHGN